MISSKLILDNAPIRLDEQIHVNHTGCASGEDRKKRLYIKRTVKGLVAYCHHCNEHGFILDGTGRLSTWIRDSEAPTPRMDKKLEIAPLSTAGKMWLLKYFCDVSSPSFMGVSGYLNKVALALHNPQQQQLGWQVRDLTPNTTPKYLTHYNSSKGESAWFNTNSTALIITEDYLSAYRVSRDTGHSAVALLRTSITDKTLCQINELAFGMVFIWLDPDEAGITGAAKAYKKLSYYLPRETTIVLMGMDKEPKEMTPDELRSALL